MTTIKKQKGLCILFAFLLVLAMGFPALAASADEGAGFSIKAVLPDNQISAGKGYFYLQTQPNGKQDLVVQVTNTSAKEITVQVEADPGISNTAGSIEYRPLEEGERDESMKYAFSDIATILEPTLKIPAGATVESVVSIQMPDEAFDGMIIGGLLYTKEPEKRDSEGEGIGIQNVYQYVTGVVLESTGVMPKPELELLDVFPDIVSGQSALIYKMRNPQPVIADNLHLQIEVFKAGETTPLLEKEQLGVRFAPQTIMNYTHTLGGYRFEAGEYLAKIKLTGETESWEFEKNFTIKAETAQEINKENVREEETSSQGMPTWALILIIAVILVVVLLIVVVILLLKRRSQ